MSLLQHVAKLFGHKLLANGDLAAVLEAKRKRTRQKDDLTHEARDVLRDFVHGINAQQQRDVVRRGE